LIGRVFGGGAALVLFVIGAGAGSFGLPLLREYVLYLLRAGHVAVITEIIEQGSLPEDVNQTQWGRDKVTAYFKEISVLALVDQLIKGIIGMLNRVLFNVMTILPIPGLEGAAKVAQKVVDFSLTYVDESILSYTFKTRNKNVYDAAKTGIILYCQAWERAIEKRRGVDPAFLWVHCRQHPCLSYPPGRYRPGHAGKLGFCQVHAFRARPVHGFLPEMDYL
ncbi:MAG: hypothetical protein GXY07_07480, partial [Candidatus Hydrogenedentes bacterium]|nr:hypothetical protein [Candidatus Hydrogenedentota bacterium]